MAVPLRGYGQATSGDPNYITPLPESLPYQVAVAFDKERNGTFDFWGTFETKDVPPDGDGQAKRGELKPDWDACVDQSLRFKALSFNPVPGPPILARSSLRFSAKLIGTDELRVQVFNLTRGFCNHYATIKGLPQNQWFTITIDMLLLKDTRTDRGYLRVNDRIDDVQFYADKNAELLVGNVYMYNRVSETAVSPFSQWPTFFRFLGWFDTGGQTAGEWPSEASLNQHQNFLDDLSTIPEAGTNLAYLKVAFRKRVLLDKKATLFFRYYLVGTDHLQVTLNDATTGLKLPVTVTGLTQSSARPLTEPISESEWRSARISYEDLVAQLPPSSTPPRVTDVKFELGMPAPAELRVDDVYLFAEESQQIPTATPSAIPTQSVTPTVTPLPVGTPPVTPSAIPVATSTPSGAGLSAVLAIRDQSGVRLYDLDSKTSVTLPDPGRQGIHDLAFLSDGRLVTTDGTALFSIDPAGDVLSWSLLDQFGKPTIKTTRGEALLETTGSSVFFARKKTKGVSVLHEQKVPAIYAPATKVLDMSSVSESSLFVLTGKATVARISLPKIATRVARIESIQLPNRTNAIAAIKINQLVIASVRGGATTLSLINVMRGGNAKVGAKAVIPYVITDLETITDSAGVVRNLLGMTGSGVLVEMAMPGFEIVQIIPVSGGTVYADGYIDIR